MRHTVPNPRGKQLHLFHPRPQGPIWHSLPPAVREVALGLMAQLLLEHQRRRDVIGRMVEEVTDE